MIICFIAFVLGLQILLVCKYRISVIKSTKIRNFFLRSQTQSFLFSLNSTQIDLEYMEGEPNIAINC